MTYNPPPTFSDEAASLPVAPQRPESKVGEEQRLAQVTIQKTPAILGPLLQRFGLKVIKARENKLLAMETKNDASFQYWSAIQDAYQEELDWLTEGTQVGPPVHTSVQPAAQRSPAPVPPAPTKES